MKLNDASRFFSSKILISSQPEILWEVRQIVVLWHLVVSWQHICGSKTTDAYAHPSFTITNLSRECVQ